MTNETFRLKILVKSCQKVNTVNTDLLTPRERDDAEETEDLSQRESVELIIHSEWMTVNN